MLENLERLRSLLNLALNLDMAAIALETQKTTKHIQKSVQDLAVDSRLEKIYRWLSSPDPWKKYHETLQCRHQGSGAWLTNDNEIFRSWRVHQKGGSFLWLFGIPGCGKTVLSSTIIEHVRAECNSDPNKSDAVAFYFFDFREDKAQGVEKMLRCLIDQLARQSASAFDNLESLYNRCRSKERQPAQNELLTALHDIINCFRNVFIVLDALDECNQNEERAKLLKTLSELEMWEGLKIITTSRPEQDIKTAMERSAYPRTSICIESSLIQEDIRAYVHARLRSDTSLRRWRNNPSIQAKIENVLSEKANGM